MKLMAFGFLVFFQSSAISDYGADYRRQEGWRSEGKRKRDFRGKYKGSKKKRG